MKTGDNAEVIDETNREEETEGEELEEGQEGSEADGEGSESEEWTPPTKTEFTKVMRESDRRGNKIKELKAKIAEYEAKSTQGLTDVEKAKEEARAQEAERYKTRIINTEATAGLTKLGLKPEVNAKRLIKMLDLEEIDVDPDDGELTGLDEQLADLKESFPDLFTDAKKVRANPATRKDAADRPPVEKKETGIDRIAKAMLGVK